MVFTSKFVGTGPSSYKKRIYRTSVSEMLRNTALDGQLQEEFKCNFFVPTAFVCIHLRLVLAECNSLKKVTPHGTKS